MKLDGEKVKHKSFGEGTIIKKDGKYIFISFKNGEKKLQYPNSFEKFLIAKDNEVQSYILKELAIQKELEIKEREEKEKKKREEEKERLELLERQLLMKSSKTLNKVYAKVERIPNKPLSFYVFQGTSFEIESRYGCLWAPFENKEGRTFHHWEKLEDVQKDDIIFHGVDGYIKAISIAKGEFYKSEQPEELRTADLWERIGRKIDTEYIILKNPIKTEDFKDHILEYCNVKYAPFNKEGTGNMGYLFDIDSRLSNIFMEAIIRANPVVNDYLTRR